MVNFEFVLAKDDKITRHCICGGEKKKGECSLKGKNGGILVRFGFNSVKIFENEDTYCWSLGCSSRWPGFEEKNNLKMKGSLC